MVTTMGPRAEVSAAAARGSPGRAGAGWGRWLWRFLTSMRTAVVLLVLLAVAAVPGSVLPQRNVASDPFQVELFYQEHPRLAPLLDRLYLFDVYGSPWFAATYLLLLISMTGCVVPRSVKLWRAARTPPPPAPRRLSRESGHRSWTSTRDERDVLDAAARHLRRRRFRVVQTGHEVRAERGYLREVGNLVFHLSLLVLLFGMAAGRLFGYEARVAVAEGGTFTNIVSEYDAFTPSVWTDTERLEPLQFRLDSFDAEFATTGSRVGEPRGFDAALTYQAGGREPRTVTVRPNQPLDVNGTKFFLTGHGYAPVVTVRDGNGEVTYSGPVIFLPRDANFASDGVIKAPDASPAQLAFEGAFLPTAVQTTAGPRSAFPGLGDPRLLLTAFTGDVGLNDGAPESIYTLDKSRLQPVLAGDGEVLRSALAVGDTMALPQGLGSLRFDGVARFANFQVARDPGKEVVLVAALLLLLGLTTSLTVRRRQVWVRCAGAASAGGVRVEVAGRSLGRREPDPDELVSLGLALGGPPGESSERPEPSRAGTSRTPSSAESNLETRP